MAKSNDLEKIKRLSEENQLLQQTTAHYRTLFMNAPLGLFRSTFEGRFLEVNLALAGMLGYESPEEVVQGITSISDQIYVHTEHRREIVAQQVAQQKDRKDIIQQYTNHYRKKDGSTFVANLYLRTVYDRDGNPQHLEGIIEDITERRRLENRLAHSEELHRLTLENISDAVFITDWCGRLTFICPNTAGIFGLSGSDMTSLKTVSALFPDPLFDIERLVSEEEISNIEARITDRQGHQHDLLVNIRCASIGQGRVLYTCRDITDIKQMAAVLEDEKRQFDTIINELPQFVAYTDKDLRYRFVNKTYESAFNSSFDKIKGKPVVSVIGDRAFEKVLPHIKQVLAGDRVNYKETLKYPNGKTMDIDGTLIPDMDEEGRVKGYFAVLSDMTAYNNAARELKRHAAKLEQMNTALNVLVDHRDKKKEKRETEILKSFQKLVFPYLDIPPDPQNLHDVDLTFQILKKNINEILSGSQAYEKNLYRVLSPLEIRVADLIKADKTTKEIADVLHLSVRTVYFHRENIRKKLNLRGQKINLKAFLDAH